MYEWLWRKLPFGLPGKIAGSVLLAGAVVALLWYVAFPQVDPLLPFDDVQVEPNAPATTTDPSGSPLPEETLAYPTTQNSRPPTPS